MPIKGNKFTVCLKKTHIAWGEDRKTNSRPKIKKEGFLPIPRKYAKAYNITNNKCAQRSNIYTFSTSDKFYTDEQLKASGNGGKADMYAKNFHGNGNLKLLGAWFSHMQAKVGDCVDIEFVSSYEILLTFMSNTSKKSLQNDKSVPNSKE